MKIEFRGEPDADPHQDFVLWEAEVDGRRVRCRFTRDAVRSVMPTPADRGDLRARVASRRDVFARLVAARLAGTPGAPPDELTIAEADVPAGS